MKFVLLALVFTMLVGCTQSLDNLTGNSSASLQLGLQGLTSEPPASPITGLWREIRGLVDSGATRIPEYTVDEVELVCSELTTKLPVSSSGQVKIPLGMTQCRVFVSTVTQFPTTGFSLRSFVRKNTTCHPRQLAGGCEFQASEADPIYIFVGSTNLPDAPVQVHQNYFANFFVSTSYTGGTIPATVRLNNSTEAAINLTPTASPNIRVTSATIDAAAGTLSMIVEGVQTGQEAPQYALTVSSENTPLYNGSLSAVQHLSAEGEQSIEISLSPISEELRTLATFQVTIEQLLDGKPYSSVAYTLEGQGFVTTSIPSDHAAVTTTEDFPKALVVGMTWASLPTPVDSSRDALTFYHSSRFEGPLREVDDYNSKIEFIRAKYGSTTESREIQSALFRARDAAFGRLDPLIETALTALRALNGFGLTNAAQTVPDARSVRANLNALSLRRALTIETLQKAFPVGAPRRFVVSLHRDADALKTALENHEVDLALFNGWEAAWTSLDTVQNVTPWIVGGQTESQVSSGVGATLILAKTSREWADNIRESDIVRMAENNSVNILKDGAMARLIGSLRCKNLVRDAQDKSAALLNIAMISEKSGVVPDKAFTTYKNTESVSLMVVARSTVAESPLSQGTYFTVLTNADLEYQRSVRGPMIANNLILARADQFNPVFPASAFWVSSNHPELSSQALSQIREVILQSRGGLASESMAVIRVPDATYAQSLTTFRGAYPDRGVHHLNLSTPQGTCVNAADAR